MRYVSGYIPSVRTTIHCIPSPNDLWLSGTHLKEELENFTQDWVYVCNKTEKVSVTIGVLPQSSRESRDAAQKGEGDDDEEEGEEDCHVAARGNTFSCYGQAFLASRSIAHNAATACECLNTHAESSRCS